MTPARKIPAHGTIARYRLELREQKAGRGTGPCDRCRAANTARARNARSNAEAHRRRAQLTIVGDVAHDVTTGVTSEGHGDDVPPHTAGSARRVRTVGEMEAAVGDDIEEIDEPMQVPFHRSLSVLALQLAREIDEPATPANVRSQSSRQLFEVLRSLRTRKEGDDNSAVAVALQAAGFGTPLVP